jgi:hypothetical protein
MDTIKNEMVPLIVQLSIPSPGGVVDIALIEPALVELKLFIDRSYKRPEGVYSRIRKMILAEVKEEAVVDLVKKTIRMTRAQFDASNAALKKIVEAKNARQTVFDIRYISRVISGLKETRTFSDLFFLLQLACGARCIEILDASCSAFGVVDNDPHKITQTGFAKKGEASQNNSICKPLLWMSSLAFLRDLEIVRSEVKGRCLSTRKSITKSFNTQLLNRGRHLWPQHVINGRRTGTHINRAIYANAAYHLHASPSESLTHFIKQKLGHDSMGSAAHYMNVAVAFSTDPQKEEEAARQEGLFERAAVKFESNSGEEVYLDLPQTRRMPQKQRDSLVKKFASKMKDCDVKITKNGLLSAGFHPKDIAHSKVLNKGMFL